MQFVNEAFAKMVGYTANEVVGMDFRQFIAPEDIDRVSVSSEHAAANAGMHANFACSIKMRNTRRCQYECGVCRISRWYRRYGNGERCYRTPNSRERTPATRGPTATRSKNGSGWILRRRCAWYNCHGDHGLTALVAARYRSSSSPEYLAYSRNCGWRRLKATVPWWAMKTENELMTPTRRYWSCRR